MQQIFCHLGILHGVFGNGFSCTNVGFGSIRGSPGFSCIRALRWIDLGIGRLKRKPTSWGVVVFPVSWTLSPFLGRIVGQMLAGTGARPSLPEETVGRQSPSDIAEVLTAHGWTVHRRGIDGRRRYQQFVQAACNPYINYRPIDVILLRVPSESS